MRYQCRDQAGFAVVLVLGIVAILGAVGGSIVAQVSRSIGYATFTRELEESRRMAEAGVNAAAMLLEFDGEEDRRNNAEVDYFITINEADAMDALSQLSLNAEIWSLFRPGNQSIFSAMGLPGNFLPLGDQGGVELVIEDLSGRWNVHSLMRPQGWDMDDDEVLAAVNGMSLLVDDDNLGREIVAATIDWLDEDDEQVDPAGAETRFYQSLTPSYQPRNGPMQHVGELRALRGVDEQVYGMLNTAVTVWPNDLANFAQYKLNINTAPAEAIPFLHAELTRADARRIVEERDNGHFETTNEFNRFLLDTMGLTQELANAVATDRSTVRSSAFYVRANGMVGESAALLEAVLRRNDQGRVVVTDRRWLALGGE